MTRTKLTFTQRCLRPVINFLVETFFPHGVFYGYGYQKTFDDLTAMDGKLNGEDAVAGYLLSKIRNNHQAISYKLDLDAITVNGEEMGDWTIHVYQRSGADESEDAVETNEKVS